jgi:hypothetical protein
MDMRKQQKIKYNNFTLLVLALIILGALTACTKPHPLPAEPTGSSTPSSKPAFTMTPTRAPSPATATLTPELPPTSTPTVKASPSAALPAVSIGPYETLEPQPGMPESAIIKLLTGPDGDIWVVSEDGVSSFDGSSWIDHGDVTGVVLGFDGVGQLWIVDENGEWIAAYDGQSWIQYTEEQGWLPAGHIFNAGMYANVSEEIVTDSRGETWLVTRQDIRVLRQGYWFVYMPEEAGFIPSDFMLQEGFGFLLSDVALDATGDVWVTDCAWMGPGPQGQGARWYDGEKWLGQDSPVVASGCIKDVEVGTDGRIWVGVDDQVWRYTNGQGWEQFPHPVQFPLESLRWGWIVDLLLDGTEAVWMTMMPCGGASCDLGTSITFWIHGDEWLVVGEDQSEEGLPNVARGANDLTWGCLADGLYSVADGEFIPVEENRPSHCQVQADHTGRIWLSLIGQPGLWVFDAP